MSGRVVDNPITFKSRDLLERHDCVLGPNPEDAVNRPEPIARVSERPLKLLNRCAFVAPSQRPAALAALAWWLSS